MITIIEGPDGVGKTSYARHLSRMAGGVPILHWGAPTHKHWIDEYVTPVQDALSQQLTDNPQIICDRGFFAEPMWAKIFGRPVSLFANDQEVDACARWYEERGCRIIFIERDESGIIRASHERGESPQELARALESVSLYKRAARQTERLWGIPTTILDSDSVHDEVQRWS